MGEGPFWIPLQARGRLATMPRPRGGDRLLDDLRRLRADGVTVVVSLLEDEEARELELSTEADACTEVGLAFSRLPLPDRSVPQDAAAFWSFSRGVEAAVEHGEAVVSHCRAGIGRSSLVAAAVLVLRGASPTEALATISTARGLSVPDTKWQREWFTRTARAEGVGSG